MSQHKRTSLLAAVNQTTNEPAETTTENTPPEKNGTDSRKDKKIISGHFDLAVSKQLKQIAAEEDKTIQELLGEALNDLFIKKNRLPIA